MADSILKLRVESSEYDNKLKRAAEGLQRYAEGCRKAGGTLTQLDDGVLEFTKALGRMETVSKNARGSLGEMTKAFTDMKIQYKQLTDEEKSSPFGRALNDSLNQLKGRIIETKKDLQDINDELSGSKFGQFGSIIDGIGQKMGITGNLTEMLTSKTALMTTGIGAATAAIGKSAEAWAKYNAELAKQDQITTVTTGLNGEDADRMTDKMRALSDTYNIQFRDAINAANTLMSQFGESGDSAIQLIKDGMQGMIHGDGPKLLQMIQQYAPAFRDAGVSASQLVAVIQNSEGGIFTDQNMNAIVMGIKNIRLMTKSTSDALAQLGIDGKRMSEQMSNGTMTVFDALKQVATELQTVDSNSKTAGEVMQQVFGRQGVTAGTNLAKAIESLNTNLEETKNQTGEVGKAFAELQVANEKLNLAIRDAFGYDGWEQMATGIRAKLITALAEVIDKLGVIRNWFDNFNPGSVTNTTGVDKQLQKLRISKAAGSDSYAKTAYGSQMEEYNRKINSLDNYIKQFEKNRSSVNTILQNASKQFNQDFKSIEDLRDLSNAYRSSLEDYKKRGSAIISESKKTDTNTPVTPLTPQPTNPKGGTKTPKTEEQLNNEQIQKLTQEYIEATDERRKAIKAEIKGLQQRNEEIQKLKDIALGKFKDDGSLPALTRQLQDLQKQQSQAANGAEWDNYQKKIVETTDKINVLKGVLPKDKRATFTMNVNTEQLEQLRMLLPTDDKTIRINVEEGEVNLPKIPTDDKTIRINVTADTAEAMRQVRDMVGDIEGMDVVIEPKVEIQEPDLRTPFQRLQDSIRLELSAKNVDVDKNTLKSLTEVVTKYDIQTGTIDISKVMAQTEELTKGGMTAGEAYAKALQDAMVANLDLSTIQQRIGEEIDIPDETWQKLQDEINAKLKELGIEPIQIDFSTGNVKKQSKEMSKDWNAAAQAVQAVGSAMASIEDPATKVVGTIAQAIASIALGYATATTQAATLGPWAWVAFAATGMAQMVSMISAIHSATGYAQGGMIKGNSYSGDNIGGLVDGSQLVGLNAGELVLSASQQSVLAGNLQAAGGGKMEIVGVLTGENVVLMVDRWGRRTGRGELLFGKNL